MKILALLLLATTTYAGQSTSHVWSPRRAEIASGSASLNTNPRCVEWVAPLTITGTSLTWQVAMAMGAGKHCSVGLFSKDGTTRLVTSGPQLCDAAGVHNVAGLGPFNIAAGVAYQVCYCGEQASGQLVNAPDIALPIQGLDGSLSVPIRLSGGNACTGGGDVPASLGTLNTDTGASRLLLLIGTNTP